MQVTIGGDRLGAGNKNKVSLREYERSSHDMGYVWRSTMAAGTLVPFMCEVALPGDTFDINLDVDVLTHPTIGPLFGTYKIQLDVFQIPIRLYQAGLHMNMLGIGRDMSKILLPQMVLEAAKVDATKPIDNQQINPSCLLSYLGIRGLGQANTALGVPVREFNAIPLLAYWDIYKNYYANKQEGIGAVIHKNVAGLTLAFTDAEIKNSDPEIDIPLTWVPSTYTDTIMNEDTYVILTNADPIPPELDIMQLKFRIERNGIEYFLSAVDIFQSWDIIAGTNTIRLSLPFFQYRGITTGWGNVEYTGIPEAPGDDEPIILTFPLTNIDDMRLALLQEPIISQFYINSETPQPYGQIMEQQNVSGTLYYSKMYGQEGLGLKTYNSDLFNNWISTDWIDGIDGVSAVTAIDTSEGSFTIDELNLSRKIYDMLNRIAISGGSYDDWLDVVYTEKRTKTAENPMYLGGKIKNLVFQEVVSNSASQDQPLGTLAGRGKLGGLDKGGQIIAKIDEPSYLIGIVSLTPNIDYSQGNKWDTNLKTMNDFHKPALDEIGFQDLITDQMAWYDTEINGSNDPVFKSAGKQPAWINYMTNVNQVRGNFAEQTQQMFMVLNRRYSPQYSVNGVGVTIPTIDDLTTYIDPTKFNHIFADTRRDAQNFWCQIGLDITARRKMSAKVMPNL